MSGTPPSPDQNPVADAAEVALDVTAFLPEGVRLAAADEADSPDGPDLEALGQIERDLDAVDAAIAALEAGTYGVDPATGQPIPDELLAEDPTRLS